MSGIVYSAEQKKIHVSLECPEDVRVSHDSKWTEEAIFNLLDNAVKYTPTGGSIHVSVAQWEMYVEIKCIRYRKRNFREQSGIYFQEVLPGRRDS